MDTPSGSFHAEWAETKLARGFTVFSLADAPEWLALRISHCYKLGLRFGDSATPFKCDVIDQVAELAQQRLPTPCHAGRRRTGCSF